VYPEVMTLQILVLTTAQIVVVVVVAAVAIPKVILTLLPVLFYRVGPVIRTITVRL
jgi:hypothetical protein